MVMDNLQGDLITIIILWKYLISLFLVGFLIKQSITDF